jgi:drug/metabolite transporter (DMT)-like permease
VVGSDARGWARAMPWVFVVIWSTGFIVARYGMPHAPPFTFLSMRYALSVVCFGVWSAAIKAPWPRGPEQWRHLAVTGVLMHAGYLGGVWAAVRLGLGAGTVALLVGLQPLLTAVWLTMRSGSHARGTHPTIAPMQWLGLLLGLAGLALVVWRKLGVGEITAANLGLALAALLSITAGTLYQKRFVQRADVRTANTIQLCAALLVSLPVALLEPGGVDWHPQMVGALAWSVLALTLGGSSLLYLLIQRGAATQVTSLLYLVPPCTALMAWLLFGESFTMPMWLGMALAVFGVALVVRNSPQ